ncbi:MAG: hypothetical protein C4323_06100 [Mastigocladus sp. ERB_26_2]
MVSSYCFIILGIGDRGMGGQGRQGGRLGGQGRQGGRLGGRLGGQGRKFSFSFSRSLIPDP